MKLRDWLDTERITERLVGGAMGFPAAEAASPGFARAAAACEAAGVGRDDPVVACWAPGRIEVLGKHTDYCGGSSVLAAAERGFAMIAAAREDNRIRVIDARQTASVESAEFVLSEAASPQPSPATADLRPGGRGSDAQARHWSNYPQTVARRVAKNFPSAARGATIAFASNLPPSAGMSSSSALMVGTFLLLAEINELAVDDLYRAPLGSREQLAGYLGTVENGSSFGPLAGDRGVGTFGGSEDHTAILCGQPGKLVEYAFCPVRFERAIELADRYVFAIASSGVIAEKTGAAKEKYNRLSLLVKSIVEQWQGDGENTAPSLAAILASAPDASDRLRQAIERETRGPFTAGQLLDRLDQFEVEMQLIKSLPAAIDPSTIGKFGEIVRRSQSAAKRFLANQTEETVYLVESARRLGAHASSAFGAGFGGSVWAMIDAADESAFLAKWQEDYARKFPPFLSQSAFFASRPGAPAQVWRGEDQRGVRGAPVQNQ